MWEEEEEEEDNEAGSSSPCFYPIPSTHPSPPCSQQMKPDCILSPTPPPFPCPSLLPPPTALPSTAP